MSVPLKGSTYLSSMPNTGNFVEALKTSGVFFGSLKMLSWVTN